jgi:hypothetical protein
MKSIIWTKTHPTEPGYYYAVVEGDVQIVFLLKFTETYACMLHGLSRFVPMSDVEWWKPEMIPLPDFPDLL